MKEILVFAGEHIIFVFLVIVFLLSAVSSVVSNISRAIIRRKSYTPRVTVIRKDSK